MITDTLMATGSWTLRLKPETPLVVRDALDWTQTTAAGFGHLMVFSTRVDAPDLSAADRLAASRWTGVLLEWNDEFTISGAGPAWWLGDGDGKGDVLTTAVTRTAGTLTQWVGDLLPSSLNAGTIGATGGTATGNYRFVSRRAALEAICDAFGNEWQVTPALDLNVGTSTELWSSTPTAMVLPRFEGRDGQMSGLDAQGVARSMDLREYANTAYVLGQSVVASSTSASGYLDINGNAVTRTVVVNSSTAAPGTESTVAAAERVLRQTTRRHVVLSSSSHDIAGDISTGGYVWVYDPERGLRDTANEQFFGGQICWPLKMRVMSQSWPVREGYGVWFRDGNGTLTDLTDWFVPESGPATVEFGSINRTLSNTAGIVGSADSGKLANEVSYSAWISYTPTLTNITIGNGTLIGQFRREGTTIHYRIKLTWGSTTSSSGSHTFTLPVAPHADYTVNAHVGDATMYDSGTAAIAGTVLISSGSQIVVGTGATTQTAVATTSPMTWTTNDQMFISGTYEAA